ncbi:hypothetical protein QBC31_42870 [Streptomyces sp. B21-079]|uniref:hypothetical protein n=1 Tax=Streptomyces sp. B21-079 TaxID=3039409 RepID=UPI002FF0CFFB
MNYFLELELTTDDAKALRSAIDAEAKAADAADAPVSDNGIGLRNEPSLRSRGELVTLLLTIPVGITVDVAAAQIKSYLRYLRRKYRDHGIREATIRSDADDGEKKVELDD